MLNNKIGESQIELSVRRTEPYLILFFAVKDYQFQRHGKEPFEHAVAMWQFPLAMTDYAVPMVRLSFVVFFIATLQFACQSTLQAMNLPKITFWLGISRTLLLLIPFVWLLPMLLPDHADSGVFLARPVTDICIFVFTGIYFYRRLKRISTS